MHRPPHLQRSASARQELPGRAAHCRRWLCMIGEIIKLKAAFRVRAGWQEACI
jgi:hypothetical protein